MGWAFLVSMGASRGILSVWDNRVMESMKECIRNFFVACSFKNVEYGWKWVYAGVYGPTLDREMSLLWEELEGSALFMGYVVAYE